MKQEKLILFDIDRTLLVIDTLADMAVRAMTKEVYGVECSFKEISYAGMTDPRILEEVLKLRRIDDETIAARFDEAIEKYCIYFDYFARGNSYHLTVFPGVIPLLNALKQMPEMHIAILTGNLEYTGWKKLELARLKHYFTFGAFGSDSKVRSELVGIALKRAENKYGAEEAAANGKAGIVADLAGTSYSTYVKSEGTWTAGRSHMSYPRIPAVWCCLWLRSEGTWAFEEVIMEIMLSGKWR